MSYKFIELTDKDFANMSPNKAYNIGFVRGTKNEQEQHKHGICKDCLGYCPHIKDEGFCDWLNIKCEPDFYCKDFEAKEKPHER